MTQIRMPGSNVQRCTAVATLDPDCLADIEPDPHRQRTFGMIQRFIDELVPQRQSAQRSRPRRPEYGERFVTAQLDQLSAVRFHGCMHDFGEPLHQLSGGLISFFGRVAGVAPNIRNQEGQHRRCTACARRLFWDRQQVGGQTTKLVGRRAVHGGDYSRWSRTRELPEMTTGARDIHQIYRFARRF